MKGIKNLMSFPLITATPQDTIGAVQELMTRHRIGAIPIVANEYSDEIVGLVTDGDLRNFSEKDTHVEQVMGERLFYVEQNAAPAVAAALMLKYGTHHLLVKKEDRVVGILSSIDLIQLIASGRLQHWHANLSFI